MIARPSRVRRRTKLSALAAAATLALTGCAGLAPGVAAEVGSETITHDEVDEVAQALCTANIESAAARGEAAPNLPSRGAREGAMQVLLDTALSQQFGEQEGVDPNRQQVSQALAQNEVGLALLPADEREAFRNALREYAEGQLILIEIGRRSLQQSGQTEVTDEEALAEGQRLRAQFVESVEVEVDPRYGTFADGSLRPSESSLSVPVSDSARAASNPNPGDAWVSGLPASQRCS